MGKQSNKELNDKNDLFCKEYIVDFNGSQAAVRAGYSAKSSKETASRLLTKANIQKRIAELVVARNEKLDLSAQRVLQEYQRIAFSDIRKFYTPEGTLKNITDLDDDSAAMLAGIDVDELWEYNMDKEMKEQVGVTKKIKMWDKLKALESLSKHMGLFQKDNEQAQPQVHLQITGMKIT